MGTRESSPPPRPPVRDGFSGSNEQSRARGLDQVPQQDNALRTPAYGPPQPQIRTLNQSTNLSALPRPSPSRNQAYFGEVRKTSNLPPGPTVSYAQAPGQTAAFNSNATYPQALQAPNPENRGTYATPISQTQGLALAPIANSSSPQGLQSQSYGNVLYSNRQGSRGTSGYFAPAPSYSVPLSASASHSVTPTSQIQSSKTVEHPLIVHELNGAAATSGQHLSHPSRTSSMPYTTTGGSEYTIPSLSRF